MNPYLHAPTPLDLPAFAAYNRGVQRATAFNRKRPERERAREGNAQRRMREPRNP
jgi:hypothetical protein